MKTWVTSLGNLVLLLAYVCLACSLLHYASGFIKGPVEWETEAVFGSILGKSLCKYKTQHAADTQMLIIRMILSFHPPDGADINIDKSPPFVSSCFWKNYYGDKYVMFMRQLCFKSPLNCFPKSYFKKTRETVAISIKPTPLRNRHNTCKWATG